MKEVILAKLDEIKKAHQVSILFACESGSRAWGFASPDSDYDVRFIYVQQRNKYLSISNIRDVIELPVNEVLDISGWDLKKALGLYRKTNATIYEWLQSPIVYEMNENFHRAMLSQMSDYYSMVPGFHHYISMTLNCFKNDLQGQEVKLKKYFYALRPVLAAKWIIDKMSVPPMEFSLLRQQISDKSLQSIIDELLERKMVAPEKAMIAPVKELQEFIRYTIDYCNERKGSLAVKDINNEPLNILFRKSIGIDES